MGPFEVQMNLQHNQTVIAVCGQHQKLPDQSWTTQSAKAACCSSAFILIKNSIIHILQAAALINSS
jgi:hypothetical protein